MDTFSSQEGLMYRDHFSPIAALDVLKTKHSSLTVVRDDLLPGGTKQRACAPFLEEMRAKGHTEFIYASPFSGFAQIALAFVCQELGLKCTIVCEKDQRYPSDDRLHPFSVLARDYGATMILSPSLKEAEEEASHLESLRRDSIKLPLGFDCQEFRSHLKVKLLEQWQHIRLHCPAVTTLWLPLGSGTLAKTFNEILPPEIRINCVNVRVLDSADQRIRGLESEKRIRIFHAPMEFHEEARDLPGIPSNIFYDAKLWGFIKESATTKDLWWNVAQ